MEPLRVRVDYIDAVADGVVAVSFRNVTGAELPGWDPGAHVELTLPNWLTRHYSLCGDPADPSRYRIAVRRERTSRGGSEYVHEFLRIGQELTMSFPRNNFTLVQAPEYVFIAGGIGVTPILPMVRAAAGSARLRVVYTGRSSESMPFREELAALAGGALRTHSGEPPDLAELVGPVGPGTQVYACGPGRMLEAVEAGFATREGVSVHVERFRPRHRVFAPDTAFDVVCARSDRRVRVEVGVSTLDALQRAGLPVTGGCREGVCGTCGLGLLGGDPEHRDDIGGAGGTLYPCVSRSLSPELLLDV